MTTGAQATAAAASDFDVAGTVLRQYLERIPVAIALTRGASHVLVYANGAFEQLAGRRPAFGTPIADGFEDAVGVRLTAILDRAFRTGVVSRDRRIELSPDELCCTAMPNLSRRGETEHLLVELRVATPAERTWSLQRDVAEQMLLVALREGDVARVAEHDRRSATFLADEGRRLSESLDEETTLGAMAGMSLPYIGAWCIVDILADDGTMRRLAIVHPDPAKQAVAADLQEVWRPHADDRFGLPAMLRDSAPVVNARDIDEVIGGAAGNAVARRILEQLGVGPLLTVPLLIRDRLVGAVTFVGAQRDRPYSPGDIALAGDLANRSAMALDRARLYSEAVTLKRQAESANEAKTAFLGSMSHELRTPLNAIGGYVELIEMGLHGPVTDQQRIDLARIRASQLHLAGLVEDVLSFTKLSAGQVDLDIVDVVARDAVTASAALVEPLISRKQLQYEGAPCDGTIVVRADPERLSQILVNLLSNAIKFTAPGGRIRVECEAWDDHIAVIHVADTGIGIAAEKLEAVFDPFVQVKGSPVGADHGVGLGLSIARRLARAMDGDLTVESTIGEGTTFTLALPRSS